MLAGGEDPELLTVFLDWMRSRGTEALVADLRRVGYNALINFDAAVGAARLSGFLTVADEIETTVMRASGKTCSRQTTGSFRKSMPSR